MIENELIQDFPLDTPFIRRMKDKGRDEERHEIARNMRQEGMEVELIAKFTGLRVEEVEQLQN